MSLVYQRVLPKTEGMFFESLDNLLGVKLSCVRKFLKKD